MKAKGARQVMKFENDVAINSGKQVVRGTLIVPSGATAVVVFAHGSGSGRFSPRNQYVAQVLQEAGLATLLVDLLEEEEANDRARVFDIALLAGRLESVAHWLASLPETAPMRSAILGPARALGRHSWPPQTKGTRSVQSSRAEADPIWRELP